MTTNKCKTNSDNSLQFTNSKNINHFRGERTQTGHGVKLGKRKKGRTFHIVNSFQQIHVK